MSEWLKLMENKFFITDLGAEQKATINGEPATVGRYAVWSPAKKARQHSIVEVGSNLEALKKKYAVSDERICRINNNPS